MGHFGDGDPRVSVMHGHLLPQRGKRHGAGVFDSWQGTFVSPLGRALCLAGRALVGIDIASLKIETAARIRTRDFGFAAARGASVVNARMRFASACVALAATALGSVARAGLAMTASPSFLRHAGEGFQGMQAPALALSANSAPSGAPDGQSYGDGTHSSRPGEPAGRSSSKCR
jgi:hypothetical protein